jgi:hypothetical protein
MFFELMKISEGRRISCSVPWFNTISLMDDVQGMVRERRLELVGRAQQHLRPLDLLVHRHDISP